MKNRMWSACAGAVAMLMLLPGAPASAQQKAEITLSRQPGIFYMPSHIMEKNKLIEKHAASLGVPGVTTKWINLSGGGAQTDALAGRQRRHPQHRHRQSAAAVGSHPRRRQGHRRHLGAADDADQPRRQYQVDQGFRPERQDRGADRQGLDAGDRAADRGRRSLRRRPMVEARCQHRAARPSRRLCGDDQHPARGAQSLSRFRRSRSSN